MQLKFSCKDGEGLGNQLNKAKERLKSIPNDYTYTEARYLLNHLGYNEYSKGKTSGSRVVFVKGNQKILLHKPHPGDEMKKYAVDQLKELLELRGEL